MDFMKVLDQTVREIKREVNIKVLKVPEIEQKVLDATSNEPWGPHGSSLTEIAQATKKFTECQLIMSTLWGRLGDGGRNWRHVYKALAVLEYLIAHGAERALDDIIEHTFQISTLSSFEFVEPNGKDMGINVRKKAETITGLLSNKDKIQEVRDKAAANRDKYFGLSSTGITYKSSTASTGFGSSSFHTSDRYGGVESKKEGDMFKESYRDKDRFGGFESSKDGRGKSSKGSSHSRRSEDVSFSTTSKAPSKLDGSDDKYGTISSQTSGAADGQDDDFDDFDPRGTSKTDAAAVNANQMNFFDLMDAPATTPPEMSTTNGNAATEVDLFEDADFVSAPSSVEAGAIFQTQGNVDLFASQPTTAFTSVSSSPVDLFAKPDPPPNVQTKTISPKTDTVNSQTFDPFASMPMNNFDGGSSDPFGDFTSHTTDQVSAPEPTQKLTAKQDSSSFQVKSGIWADSLSRGLIDLNITGPKKVNLTDLGIVGGLNDGSDEKEKGPPVTHMGRAMGTGSGLGRSMSGFNSSAVSHGPLDDDFFSSLNFKK
ncbi:hypothetical protein ACHQM5_001950 [Ranunculus cassubicifolius]